MLFKFLLPLALLDLASAQNSNMSLTAVLTAQNEKLSTFNSLLSRQPVLASALASASGITILTPSNDAFSKLLYTTVGMAAAKDPETVKAILQYHILNRTVPSSAFTISTQFIPNLLANQTFTNVTGGQVVGVTLSGKSVEVMSGLKEISTVTTAVYVMFSGGVIHIIDTILTIPLSPAMSAVDSSLTALAGALIQANLVSAVNNLKDVTIFAPSNAAFQAIGSVASALSTMQLAKIIEYHIINGTVDYSSLLKTGLANESFSTIIGTQVAIEYVDKKVFVNSAEVTIVDIIVANGVMHVLDSDLNPSNSTATPVNSKITTQPVAFAGASSVAAFLFTSGISATTTAPSASTMTAAAAGSMPSGAMGTAALFGISVVVAAL